MFFVILILRINNFSLEKMVEQYDSLIKLIYNINKSSAQSAIRKKFPKIQLFKSLLAQLLFMSGITNFIFFIQSKITYFNRIIILAYHRVNDNIDIYNHGLSISVSNFSKILMVAS